MTDSRLEALTENGRILIVIPALKPPKQILRKYMTELFEYGFKDILLIDDGSGNEYIEYFDELVDTFGCGLITHPENLGKGAAIKNALKLYLEKTGVPKYVGLITVDSDGQHLPRDVSKLSGELLKKSVSESNNPYILLGSRHFQESHVPFKSKAGNLITRFLFKLLYGLDLSDTQTGLRAFPDSTVHQFAELEGDRYEYELKVLMHCAINDIDVVEFPIETVYLNNNEGSHFNPLKDSYRIYKVLLGTFIKFFIISFSSFLVDIIIFTFAVNTFNAVTTKNIFLSTILARVISALYNFFMNKVFVFKSRESTDKSLIKYALLAFTQLSLSSVIVSILYNIFQRNVSIIKLVVDALLFFISYRIQQKYIFKEQ